MFRILLLTDTHWHYSDLNDKLVREQLEKITVEEKIDCVLHSGDVGSHYPECTKDFCIMIRKIFPSIPIGMVQGNHSYWKMEDDGFNHIQDIEDYYIKMFQEFDITYLQYEAMEFELPDNEVVDNKLIYITGFNGWYQNPKVPTKDSYRIPNYYIPGEGLDWLKKQEALGFQQSITNCTEAKSRLATTLLVTHFGFIEGTRRSDWKSRDSNGIYFGANLSYEDHLDSTDYFIFGHSHSEYDAVAKNGRTKCINVGSDYESPRYRILEI